MSLQLVIIHLIIKQFLCCILIIILQQCVCSAVTLDWKCKGWLGLTPAYHCRRTHIHASPFQSSQTKRTDIQHPIILQFFQLFWFDRTSSLLLLLHQHFNLYHFCIVLSWSRCSCQEGSHLNHYRWWETEFFLSKSSHPSWKIKFMDD